MKKAADSAENCLNAEQVRHLFNYDPQTGIFTWRNHPKAPSWVGKRAGSRRPDGYRQILILGRLYLEHRIAWLFVTGEFPPQEIDHIDQNPSNNALSNLRPASRELNEVNKGLQKNNTSGYRGVSWSNQYQKWRASLWHHGKNKYLGAYDDKEEAYAAYCAAAKQLSGEFFNGGV
ncbi:HNH endonuclease protein [Rhizobium phage RHph_I3_18]|nr:HNH endonuclease protein [Rhizobium phage RHph_I3_18]